MSTFSISLGGVTIAGVHCDEDVGEICDRHSAPIPFMCRGASCGTCAVRVVEGHANLPDIEEAEQLLLEALFDAPHDVRLACQLKVRGSVTLAKYEG